MRGLLADVFGLPAAQPHQQEASALGAALLAAQAVGLIPDAAATARALGHDAPTQPDPRARPGLPRGVRALPRVRRRAPAAVRLTATPPGRKESI